ncbi:hypothetical protein [Actinomadura mexicana]|uniref:Uncharacterized protein n=1 Tax=Actinomadura mexicana TaxID=134959 RepID=A0A238ZI63_9ACTN|nr:hypothetical protein [Actinomadura mexicana]SNR83037.1 hypothetical protein SAMN06265355_107269 [Actinomadura mexicana]
MFVSSAASVKGEIREGDARPGRRAGRLGARPAAFDAAAVVRPERGTTGPPLGRGDGGAAQQYAAGAGKDRSAAATS